MVKNGTANGLLLLDNFLFFMITKKTIEMLQCAMTCSERDTGEHYFHFTDDVDKNLLDMFLENYNVFNLDYEIFSKAIDTIVEAFEDCNGKDLQGYIQENYTEHASIITYERLQYLNNYNDDEIASIMREYDLATVSVGCAYWYDNQVQYAIEKILELYE